MKGIEVKLWEINCTMKHRNFKLTILNALRNLNNL